ncbi:MAG TPA: phage tail sheath C-terminal domain-containing protein [Pyrinomonadaceae bacterium]|nr:phage tail sheath C-terminal domain-containing protein [Pyrinomonadaceae bacterium]
MPVTPTYPGVYVQEVPSGVRTIVGVSTSIGMFIGTAKKGPMYEPVRCTNYTDFVRTFSGDSTGGQLVNYVKLFFLNGGSDCYVMRIANGATPASVALKNEAGAEVLVLTAKDVGLAGENIRALVTYSGAQPEVTFNVDLFRWEIDSAGNRTKKEAESWKGLTMDPASPLYAVDFITQNSKLVKATPGGAIPAAIDGFSLSGRSIPVANAAAFQAALQPLFGDKPAAAKTNKFQISVGGSPYVEVDLSAITVGNQAATETAVKKAIEDRFTALGIVGIKVDATFPPGHIAASRRLQIDPAAPTTGDVFIRPGAVNDLAASLMLGTAQGGLEVSGRALQRPAPNGITFKGKDAASLNFFANLTQVAFTDMTLDALQPNGTFAISAPISMTAPVPPPSIVTVAAAGALMMQDAATTSSNGNSDGVREKFAIIAQRINDAAAGSAGALQWKAEVWGYRLAILPTGVPDNFLPAAANFTTTPAGLAGNFNLNVNLYTVGIGGASTGQQTSAALVASDGNPPTAADYDSAFLIIDSQVDLFNLMVLPPDAAVAMTMIYGNASVFCQARRAFLLMDPPTSWTSAQIASTGVAGLRVGLVKDYSAIFFPRITVDNNGLKLNIGATGAIAGLCARTDGTRGVWKAPAGTEADLRGVIGLEQAFSDGENGILNPRAVNTIRIFPNGIVNWGARTMDGDDGFASEYKYIPIRRLALYMEESLYRGLKWVVFEPNDEPLYAQIRLNVGAFMHNLFRQGAFQGQTPKDAYFVKCDKETTTENDRNLGIVNIWVGFAPLKPAEFVILYLQQMAGQIEV